MKLVIIRILSMGMYDFASQNPASRRRGNVKKLVKLCPSMDSDIPRTSTYSVFAPDRVVFLESRGFLPELGEDAAEQVDNVKPTSLDKAYSAAFLSHFGFSTFIFNNCLVCPRLGYL